MYQNLFEPYASKLRLISEDGFTQQKWENALLYFMTIVNELTAKETGAVIGHMKMIAELNESCFIKLNSVRSDLPVEVSSFGNTKGSLSADITLNLLVYNVSKSRSKEIVSFALSRTENAFSLVGKLTEAEEHEEHMHHCGEHHHENDSEINPERD